jgi:hypothetical protein
MEEKITWKDEEYTMSVYPGTDGMYHLHFSPKHSYCREEDHAYPDLAPALAAFDLNKRFYSGR